METILLNIIYSFVFIFPLISFAKLDNTNRKDIVWNVIHSKEYMYHSSRRALQKITFINQTAKQIRHKIKWKFRKSKIVRILSSTSEGYKIIKTGRLKIKIGKLKIYYNFRKSKYKLKYTFRF